MSKTIKLADVARAAGVSQGTVSNVFNRPDLVSGHLREKVEAAARQLGYRGPDPRGRLLRAGRVNAIGVVGTGPLSLFFEDGYSRAFLAGVASACQARGAGMALVSANDDELAAWNIRTALVDGFVLNCLAEGSRLVELARQRGLPFVAVDFHSGEDISVIEIDDTWGAREAVRHLITLGHRHFGVIAFNAGFDSHVGFVDDDRSPQVRIEVFRRRLAGYREAFEEAGLGEQPVFETMSDPETVGAGIDAILSRQPSTTAFVCMSDKLALIACRHLQERGYVVPDDFSIVGFDGIEEAEAFSPPLTTIRQPMVDKGMAAVDMVFAEDGANRVLVLPLELAAGGSSAPPRTR